MRKECEVLIVDDELLIRQGIINYIDWESEGFRIIGEASNGREALKIIEKSPPHIIITDVVMPIMDGIELVKIVKDDYPDIEIIVLSSFEDYEYVRSTFQYGVADYILKPELNGKKFIQTLRQVVMKIPSLLDPNGPSNRKLSIEEVIERMILGGGSAHNKEMITNHFPHRHFILLAIQWKTEKRVSKELDNIVDKLEQHLPGVVLLLITQEDSSITLLLNFNLNQLPDMKQTIRQLSEAENNNRTNLKYVLSKSFGFIEEIKSTYDESLVKMIEYLFYFPNHSLLSPDLLPKIIKNNQSFDLNHFIEVFKARQYKAAFRYATDHIDNLSTQYMRDSFKFKSFIGNIMFNIIILMGNLKFDTGDLENKKYSYFSNINEAANVDDAIDIYNSFLYEINEIIHVTNGVDGPSDIQKMLVYIEENYTEPLSLAKIASHFHFNPSYLSSYFSTHHKEGFSEYLNRVRINKSMELLKNSTISISDISGMVGYSGHSYYCKVFSKVTGISPSRFRKEYHVTQ